MDIKTITEEELLEDLEYWLAEAELQPIQITPTDPGLESVVLINYDSYELLLKYKRVALDAKTL